ncbi:MAG: PEP/pyruvate-binding domain-containing protein [Candidatus Promineifilaceae bacterium]
MSLSVLNFAQVDEARLAQVGGKARALVRLAQAGFPVPDGLVLLPAAFGETGVTDVAWEQTLAGLATWREAQPGLSLAVRSSSAVEDSLQVAYAGEFMTVLNVSTDAGIRAAIDAVYQSRLPATAYQRAHEIAAPPAMAVLVQPLLPATCAGVCFSVDPVAAADEMVINAVWGLGIGVTDGALLADSYWVHRHDLSLARQQIAVKTGQITATIAGTMETPVPAAQQSVPCLPNKWVTRLAQFALALEQFFGYPQDVEWAIADERLWILQSRPITTLPPGGDSAAPFLITWAEPADQRFYWSLWTLLPHEVLWPLEQDYVAWISRSETEKRRRRGVDWLGRALVFNGRVYRGAVPNPEPPAQRQQRQVELAQLEERLHDQGLTLWEHYRPAVLAANERLRLEGAAAADGPALAAHLEDALAVMHEHMVLHGLVWSSLSPFYAAYAEAAGISLAAAQTTAADLLVGEETMLTRFVDGLYALGVAAQTQPDVAAWVMDPPPDVLQRLGKLSPPFLNQLNAFLDVFGDTVGHGFGSEMTLCMPCLREQPQRLLRLIAPYLHPSRPSPAQVRQEVRAARDARAVALGDACPDPAAAVLFAREWVWARKAATVLEDHNYHIDQLAIGLLRRAVLLAAAWLVVQGVLSHIEEVFWLRLAEILSALRNGAPASLAALVQARQAEHAAWYGQQPPPFLGLPPADLSPRPAINVASMPLGPADEPSVAEDGVVRLHGLSASRGQAQGRARLPRPGDPQPDLQPGDILVVENAGPLWTPFFPILGGIVLAGGAIGQHAATTAREYGIPAIIHCRAALNVIQDGDVIHLDATAGIVYCPVR